MTDNPSTQAGTSVDDLVLVQQESRDLLRYMAEEFDKQLRFADHELTQTQGLLKDAIDTLTACFTGIHESVGTPQPRGDEPESGDSSPDRCDTSQLEHLLNVAIRTLQFQDLTQQLIDHALHRVSAMREVMNDIKSVPAGDEHDTTGFIEDLNSHRAAIRQKIASLDEHKTNPVSQGHMMTGEIELF